MDPKVNGRKLLDAISKDKFDDALTLLHKPVDFSVQQSGDNALHMAARKGRLDVIKAMVDNGADIRQRNQNGNTVAHYAAKEGYMEVLQYLRDLKVDMNNSNNDGNAPLHGAVIHQPMDIIELLVDYGMNPNVTNRTTGETPLHTATSYGRLPAMEGLLLKGGVPDVTDKNNRKPEDLAKTEELKQTMLAYTSLFAALQTGFVQATGMKITRDSVTSPLLIDRVGIIIESIDIPKEFPTMLYCRRERSENSSVPLKTRDEEYVYSDVFHVQISNVMRDCKATLSLPIYQAPPDKEELVLRFLSDDEEDQILENIEKVDGVYRCYMETTLIPETTCVCLVYTRPKQEDNTVPQDGTLIRSRIQKNFQLEVPAEAFKGKTTLSLKVYDSEDTSETATKAGAHTTSLLTDVFQINISGEQPKKEVKMQLPIFGDPGDGEEMAILTVDENKLDNSDELPEVVQVVPTVVNANIVFEVSHFCIYVAVPKKAIASEADLRSLKRQISNAKSRRKPATFMAVCKQVRGRKHTLLVECGSDQRSDERLQKWLGKDYEHCDNYESKATMLAPGDTFFVDVKGNATFESKSNAMQIKIVFSQCRSSFQAFAIQLDTGVFRPDDAAADVVVYKMNGREREDVCTLNVKLHIPPATFNADKYKDVQFEFIGPSNCAIGDDIHVGVMIRNATKLQRTFAVRMTLTTIEGVNVTKVKEGNHETSLPPKCDEQCMMTATPREYQRNSSKCGDFNLTTHVTVNETNEMFISVEKFSLRKPMIEIECNDMLTQGSKCTVKVSFRNSTNLVLHGGVFNVIANFVADNKKFFIKKEIFSGETVAVEIALAPRKVGRWPITASFCADELAEVIGVKVINVTK